MDCVRRRTSRFVAFVTDVADMTMPALVFVHDNALLLMFTDAAVKVETPPKVPVMVEFPVTVMPPVVTVSAPEMFPEPLNDCPQIVRGVVSVAALVAEVALVAVLAFPVTFPVRFAVMVPAAKLPEPSRATIALFVFTAVAVVAELLTFPAVAIVASFVSTMPALALMSAFTTLPVRASFEYAIAADALTSAFTMLACAGRM
jgi:hypothetical protein